MSKEQRPLSDRYRVSREVSNASLAKMVKIGLENDHKGSTARMLVHSRRKSLRETSHLYRDGSRDTYWEAEESPFDFPGEWRPEVRYRTESTREGVKVSIIDDDMSGFRIVSTTTDLDNWDESHPKQARAVRESLRRVISAFEAPSHPLRVMPDVTAIRRSAHEQQGRYARKGNDLVKKVRRLLNAMVHIGLDSLDEEAPDIPSGYRSSAYPTRTTDDEAFQENRKRIAEQHSPTFLFRYEIERLWRFIMWRQESDWNLASIVAGVGIGPEVAKRYEKVLSSLYRDLRSVDEDVIRSSSLEIACKVIEAKIVEANRMPTVKEVMPDISTIHHNRTIRIGKTLRRFKEENGQFPSFDEYGQLSAWLADQVPEQFGTDRPDKDPPGAASYGNSLKSTGCWQNKSSGATKGLSKTIREAVRYAKNNIERSEKN